MEHFHPGVPEASVDGEPAEFRYAKGDDGLGQLIYTLTEDNETVTISGDNIVGVLPAAGSGLGSELVYVEGSNAPPDVKKDQGVPVLEFVDAGGLPDDFVRDFAIQDYQGMRSYSNGESSPHIHVVVSTLSGTGLAKNLFRYAIRPVLTRLMALAERRDYQVHDTESAETVTQLTKTAFLPRANEGIAQGIVLLSGDGGVVDVVNALVGSPASPSYVPPTMAIIPTGTGNALAHSIGVTKDNTLGLSTLARGTPHNLPLLRATFSPGARLLTDEGTREAPLPLADGRGNPAMCSAVVCSWGLHAGLVADSDTAEYRRYGAERFQMAAKEALFPADGSGPHRYRAKVSLLRSDHGGREVWQALPREEHMYVLATLASDLEKGFTISPLSKPLDGALRLVHFGPMGGEEVMRIMELAYQGGKHVGEEGVGYEEVEGVRVEFEGREGDARWRRICVDGKIVRVEADGWVEVRKEARRAVNVLRLGPEHA